jgi:tetratricopeptide (TPR) repeat protein
LQLCELFQENGQFGEALTILENVDTGLLDAKGRRTVWFGRAQAQTKLGRAEEAYKWFEKLLEADPRDREVLALVAQLQLDEGTPAAAADTARRLLQAASNSDQRVDALILLARIETDRGQRKAALEWLAQAVVIEGPGNRASAEFAKQALEDSDWDRYIQALEKQIDEGQLDKEAQVFVFLEVARVQEQELGNADQALVTIMQAVGSSGDEPLLRLELASRLRRLGRHDEAVEELQRLLMVHVTRVEAWRHLSQAYEALGDAVGAQYALGPLLVLGQATAQERQLRDKRMRRPASGGAGAMNAGAMQVLSVGGSRERALTGLLEVLSDCLGKVHPPDLSVYGLTSRNKVVAPDGLRSLAERVASMMGVPEFDLFVHESPTQQLIIENTSPVSVVLPGWSRKLSDTQKAFILAEAMVHIARGTHVVNLFAPDELDVLLAAAARQSVPTYGDDLASPETFKDRYRALYKGIPRKRRKAVEDAAARYAAAPRVHMANFVDGARQTARRVALVLCDDLIGAVEVIRRTEDLTNVEGLALVRKSPIVADLLATWASRPAMILRRASGMET